MVMVIVFFFLSNENLEKDQGATRLGATGPRGKSASERVSEREGCRGFQRFSEVFRSFQRSSEVVRGFQSSSQRPSQRQISLSEALGPVAPSRVAPWAFSKQWETHFLTTRRSAAPVN